MSTLKFGQESIDLLDAAATVVREQQEKLRALNDRARSLLEQWEDELQQLQRASRRVAEKISTVRGALDLVGNDTGNDIQLALFKQEEQALKQRYVGTSERILSLQRTMQRLQWLEKQTEGAVKLLYLKSGPLGRDASQLAKIAQIRALQAQEVERQRLAREIHDGPAQVLSNAIFELEYCERLMEKDPEKLARELARLKKDLRNELGDVRNFIFDLRPALHAETGLRAMLAHYAENYQSRFCIRVEADLTDVGRLPIEHETAIYRIVQEGLQNAQKHSRASEVKLTLRRNTRSLMVLIEDNGIGFDVPEQSRERGGHFGLASMRERAQLIGGELEIVSASGKGTKVVLTVPLDSDGVRT